MKTKFIASASLFLFLLSTPIFSQDTLYVSTTGDDNYGDGSFANPWKTITHAFQQLDGTA